MPSAPLVPVSRLSRSHSFCSKEVHTKEFQNAQQGVDGALETAGLFAWHHHWAGAHADVLCDAGGLHGVPDVREVVGLWAQLSVVAECGDDAVAAGECLLELVLFMQLRVDDCSRWLHFFELVRRAGDDDRLDAELFGAGEDPCAIGSAGADDGCFGGLWEVRGHAYCSHCWRSTPLNTSHRPRTSSNDAPTP